MNKWERHDNGWQFAVYGKPDFPDVVKLPMYKLWGDTRTLWGREALARVRHDVGLVGEYLPPENIVPTWVREAFHGAWFLQQEKLPCPLSIVTSEVATEQIKQDVLEMFEANQRMIRETGFGLDLFGSKAVGEIPKMVRDSSYWAVPNVVVVDGRAKLFDFILLWGGGGRQDLGVPVYGFEPACLWMNQMLERETKKRMGL